MEKSVECVFWPSWKLEWAFESLTLTTKKNLLTSSQTVSVTVLKNFFLFLFGVCSVLVEVQTKQESRNLTSDSRSPLRCVFLSQRSTMAKISLNNLIYSWTHKTRPILNFFVKFIYSEKTTKFWEISTVDLTGTT